MALGADGVDEVADRPMRAFDRSARGEFDLEAERLVKVAVVGRYHDIRHVDTYGERRTPVAKRTFPQVVGVSER